MIFLITDANPQTQLFSAYINERLNCSVMTLEPDGSPRGIGSKGRLILLDSDHADKSCMHYWHEQATACGMLLSAFNLRNEDHAAGLVTSLHLHGAFYRQDSLALLSKGIGTLLEGGWWLSRSLMARLIYFHHAQQLRAYRPVHGLTRREYEILDLLSSGASTPQIAGQLTISEHTVKTHLYNLFRKIGVSNRFQAINWARQHLCVPSALHEPHRKIPEVREV